ncbi:MAG: hypothetical protein ACD_48C00480G0001, partial [uncultured bacterium]
NVPKPALPKAWPGENIFGKILSSIHAMM